LAPPTYSKSAGRLDYLLSPGRLSGEQIGTNYLISGMSGAERSTVLDQMRRSGKAAFIHRGTHYSVKKDPRGNISVIKEGEVSAINPLVKPRPGPGPSPKETFDKPPGAI